jgi:hypothetical protein
MTVLEKSVLDVLLPGFTHHVDIGKGTDFSSTVIAISFHGPTTGLRGVWQSTTIGLAT